MLPKNVALNQTAKAEMDQVKTPRHACREKFSLIKLFDKLTVSCFEWIRFTTANYHQGRARLLFSTRLTVTTEHSKDTSESYRRILSNGYHSGRPRVQVYIWSLECREASGDTAQAVCCWNVVFSFGVSTVQGDFCLQTKVFLSTASEHCVFQNSRPYLGQQYPSIPSYPTAPPRSS